MKRTWFDAMYTHYELYCKKTITSIISSKRNKEEIKMERESNN